MSTANKKQRREAKRKNKQKEARRRNSISPVKRLANAPGEVEVWMSEDFQDKGQMQIFVYKRAAGVSGMVAFLVDRGVVGLKDAWIRMHLDHVEFREAIERSADNGIRMRRATAEEVRPWVAGGLRWAHDNGMRLPADWTRASMFIGGVGDWQSANVSDFSKEFAGHINDLRQRLVGEPLELYLQRDDVEFIFNTNAPYMDQRTGDYLNNELDEDFTDEELEEMAAGISDEQIDELMSKLKPPSDALAARTRDWLRSQNESPSDELAEAWMSLMLGRLASKSAAPDADENEVADLGFEMLQDISSRVEESRVQEYRRAVGQVLRHLQTDPMMMRKAFLQEFPDSNQKLIGG